MYQALYRKWRPRTFDDVVGQTHITETLKNQVRTERLSHAYLFTGTRGTGKTTCAKILAKAVNCENPVDGNPCNRCRFCMGIDDGSLTDVVEMDAASNNGVDNVRQLRDEAVFSPAAARRRVYIVDEVHMLSASAFNALLKILEEPPEHLMFILATTELNKVPATILSRCQRHSFKRLDTESIVERLRYVAQQERLELQPEAAALIAGLSEGGMRDALSMLDQCSGRERIDTDTVYSAMGLAGNRQISALLGHVARHETGAAIELFERLWQEGKNPATVLGELATLQRDLLLRSVAPGGSGALLSGGYDAQLLDSFENVFSTGALIANIERIQNALDAMRSGQARTVCELCLVTLSQPGLNDSLPMLRQRVEALERRLAGGLPVIPEGAVRAAAQGQPPQQPVTAPAAPARSATARQEGRMRPPQSDGAAAEKGERPPSVNTQPEKREHPQSADAPPEQGTPAPPRAGAQPGEWETPPPPAEAPPEEWVPSPPRAGAQPEAWEPPPSPADAQPQEWTPEAGPADGILDGPALWTALTDVLNREDCGISRGNHVILTDSSQTGGLLEGNVLTLFVTGGFSLHALNNDDVAAKLAPVASRLAGRNIQVKLTDAPPQSAASRDEKLNALSKFPVVTFTS